MGMGFPRTFNKGVMGPENWSDLQQKEKWESILPCPWNWNASISALCKENCKLCPSQCPDKAEAPSQAPFVAICPWKAVRSPCKEQRISVPAIWPEKDPMPSLTFPSPLQPTPSSAV